MKKLIIIVLISFLIVGCTSTPQFSNKKIDREITVTASNWKFEPAQINVKKGETIKLNVKSTTGTHGLYISGLDVKTKSISVGKQESVVFKADKVGTFSFSCNSYCGSGHREMKGSLIVK